MTLVAEQGIQQRRTPDVVRSRVMAASEGLVSLSFVVGLAFARVALRAVGPQGVYAIGGFTGAIGAVVLLPVLGRARAPEPAVDAPAEQETVVPAG